MAWQAIFQSLDEREGRFLLTMICTDGQAKEMRTAMVDANDDPAVKAGARSVIAKLEETTSGKSRLTIRAGDVIDTTPPTPPADPDPARTKFLADFRKLQSFQRAVDLGAMLDTAKSYTDLKTLVASEWLDSYAGLI
jgi:hypothetical protein